MKKLLIIILLFFITTILIANEVADFKFERANPFEKRIYLLDSNQEKSFGYFSIRSFIQYKENTYITSGLGFLPLSVESNIDSQLNHGLVADRDVLSLQMLYDVYMSQAISLGVVGSSGLIAAITGTALVFSSFVVGISLIISGASLTILALSIFLPILLVSYNNYKKIRSKIIDTLNGIPVSFNNKEVLRIKFDLCIL